VLLNLKHHFSALNIVLCNLVCKRHLFLPKKIVNYVFSVFLSTKMIVRYLLL